MFEHKLVIAIARYTVVVSLAISYLFLCSGCQTTGSGNISVPVGSSAILNIRDEQHRAIKNSYSYNKANDDANSKISSRDEGDADVRRSNSEYSAPIDSSFLGQYYALIVGNSDYFFLDNLKFTQNDARELSLILEREYRFKIKTIINAKRVDIITALNQYRTELTKSDNLLIYFAGHGFLDEEADEGYWLPVDAEKNTPANWLANSHITSTIKAIKAKHVLVIADSCYSGKLTRGIGVGVKQKNYIKALLLKKSRTVMSSGGLEPVLDGGGKGGHSVFSSALLDALMKNQKNYIEASDIFLSIRSAVLLRADQTPEYAPIRKAGHDGGDFIFVKKQKATAN